ncbi:DUF5719 family protein [Lysinibacter sp. HNR]|uniref:DUF5719 family protein n=1 Tax=Lysinibacter sp. HNR TaxID=3031408 RepID=UPI0024349E48|nr:DUF5719 family protein [Lysinibacter sp. HNR]WGD38104.1 DUF5719 family protein [Lysinibacter sp. HNR]
MSKQKKALTLSGKIVTGVVAGGLTLGAIYALGIVNLPTVVRDPASATIDTTAASQSEIACVGSVVEIGFDPANPLSIQDIGEAQIVQFSSDSAPLDSFLIDRVGVSEPNPAAQPTAASLSAQERSTSAIVQSQTVESETVRGYTASACAPSLAESWLVAGSTVLGSSSLVLLTNPGDVTANVTLTVYSEQGLVDAPGSSNLVVEPKTQRVISLNGLAPNINASVIHVQSRGGKIAAALQQTLSQGIDATGLETSTAVAAPSQNPLIPGIRVVAAGTDHAHDDHDDSARVLRLFSPVNKNSTVKAIAYGADGYSQDLGTFEVTPLMVNEYVLPELPEGVYTVGLETEDPMLGSVRLTSEGANGVYDIAAFQAAQAFEGPMAVAVPSGPNPILSLYNPKASNATVNLTRGDSPQTITVPGGGAVQVSLEEGAGYGLDASAPIVAGVSLANSGAISGYLVEPPATDAEPLTVYTR